MHARIAWRMRGCAMMRCTLLAWWLVASLQVGDFAPPANWCMHGVLRTHSCDIHYIWCVLLLLAMSSSWLLAPILAGWYNYQLVYLFVMLVVTSQKKELLRFYKKPASQSCERDAKSNKQVAHSDYQPLSSHLATRPGSKGTRQFSFTCYCQIKRRHSTFYIVHQLHRRQLLSNRQNQCTVYILLYHTTVAYHVAHYMHMRVCSAPAQLHRRHIKSYIHVC